jgi:hypothetical protein
VAKVKVCNGTTKELKNYFEGYRLKELIFNVKIALKLNMTANYPE